jgi:hypothetical protein
MSADTFTPAQQAVLNALDALPPDQRQALCEHIATEAMRAHAAAAPQRRAQRRQPRLQLTSARLAAMRQPCPYCDAQPGQPCRNRSGYPIDNPHAARRREAS